MTKEDWANLLAGPLVEKWNEQARNISGMWQRGECADELLAHLRESGVVELLRAEALEEAAQVCEKLLAAKNTSSEDNLLKRAAQAIRAKAKLLAKGEKK